MVIRLVISLLAMVVQFPFPGTVNALDNTSIPSDQDIYFKHDGLSFSVYSVYLRLRPDGT